MDPRTEPIRQDIDSIRDSMTDKMEQIEAKVRSTVDTTTESVKQIFDVRQQVEERPWAAFGLSVLAGFALGSMGGSQSSQYRPGQPMQYYPSSSNSYQSSSYPTTSYSSAYTNPSSGASSYQGYSGRSSGESYNRSAPTGQQQSGMLSDVFGQFGDELNVMKTAAISSLVTLLRDTITQNLPQFGDEYERLRQERGSESEAHERERPSHNSATSYGTTSGTGGATSYGTQGGSAGATSGSSGASGTLSDIPGSSSSNVTTGSDQQPGSSNRY